MEKTLFSGFGIEIVQSGGRLFVRYDAGEIVVQMQEHEISEEESRMAQRSQKDAYEIVFKCQEPIISHYRAGPWTVHRRATS